MSSDLGKEEVSYSDKGDQITCFIWGITLPSLGGVIISHTTSIELVLISYVIATIAIFKIAEALKGEKIKIKWKPVVLGTLIGILAGYGFFQF